MDSSWDDLRLFLAVAESGSLTQAAQRLRVGQPTVSRRLVQLEEQLGNALCERSADGIRLTEFGEQLLEPIKRMAESAAQCASHIERRDEQPEGVVRITAPPGVAHDFVVPFAAKFQQRHPHLRLQVLARLAYLDLARREADLALRMGHTEQRELVSLYELESPVGAFAAPDYAAKLEAGSAPQDVRYVGWAPPFEDLAPNPQLAAMIPGFVPALASDDYLVQCRAAELGLGVIFLPRVRHEFAFARQLVRVKALDPQPPITGTVQLLGSKAALSLRKVRVVADAIVEELKRVTVE